MDEDEKQRLYAHAEELLSEQNFIAAVIAGAVATVLSSIAYGIVVTKWPFSYGFALVGIGIVIGFSMQYLGRGIDTRFAAIAALYTIAGWFLGTVSRIVVTLSIAYSYSPIKVLQDHSLPAFTERALSLYSLVDTVYLFVAIFAAVFLARRPLSRSERLAIGLSRMRR